MQNIRQGLTYDDVLLVPQLSNVSPSNVDVSITLGKNIKLRIPILSAPMDTVTESDMATALGKLGGLGIIHRSNTIDEQVKLVKQAKKHNILVGAATGPHDMERAKALDRAGADVIVVDCAHAHKLDVIKNARLIKKNTRALLVMGNIATPKAALALSKVADVIKVGIGTGAICTTRVVAGIGVPQLSAVFDVAKALKSKKIPVIADGGLKYSGDIVKALAAGATAVMMGSMLAGLDESPGRIIILDKKKYKSYRGMGSLAVMNKNKSGDRYFQAGSKKFVPEGIEGIVLYKGKLKDYIYQMIGGLKSGMGYIGAKNIESMRSKAEFVQISAAGLKESHPHTVIINKKAPNY
ncbi:MAG: IMP dehydrogenase [Candidatus Kuenenbacteria bacterium]